MAETMRTMGATGDSLEMIEIPKPTPGRGEVRVKVIASAVNQGEEKVIGGDFVRRFLHAKTLPLVLEWDFAGTASRARIKGSHFSSLFFAPTPIARISGYSKG